MRRASASRAASVTGPGAAGSSMSSTTAIGMTSRTVEAMNASSAARRSSSVHGTSAASHSSSRRARVMEARMRSSSGGVRSAPSRTQKKVQVGPSRTRPCGVTNSASSYPRSRASRPASMFAA